MSCPKLRLFVVTPSFEIYVRTTTWTFGEMHIILWSSSATAKIWPVFMWFPSCLSLTRLTLKNVWSQSVTRNITQSVWLLRWRWSVGFLVRTEVYTWLSHYQVWKNLFINLSSNILFDTKPKRGNSLDNLFVTFHTYCIYKGFIHSYLCKN